MVSLLSIEPTHIVDDKPLIGPDALGKNAREFYPLLRSIRKDVDCLETYLEISFHLKE